MTTGIHTLYVYRLHVIICPNSSILNAPPFVFYCLRRLWWDNPHRQWDAEICHDSHTVQPYPLLDLRHGSTRISGPQCSSAKFKACQVYTYLTEVLSQIMRYLAPGRKLLMNRVLTIRHWLGMLFTIFLSCLLSMTQQICPSPAVNKWWIIYQELYSFWHPLWRVNKS